MACRAGAAVDGLCQSSRPAPNRGTGCSVGPLSAVGGTFDDVARLTIYLVDWTGDKMEPLGIGVRRAAERLDINPVKPTTLIGVAALSEPDLLVEVEAIAVLP